MGKDERYRMISPSNPKDVGMIIEEIFDQDDISMFLDIFPLTNNARNIL